MENRYLPRTLRGIFDRFSMRTVLSVCSVSRTSLHLSVASLPARSPASRSLAEGRRFGVGRWVVSIVYPPTQKATVSQTVDECEEGTLRSSERA